MEKKERNVEIARKKLIDKVDTVKLAIEYKTTSSNINRIVSDTKAKYPELLIKE